MKSTIQQVVSAVVEVAVCPSAQVWLLTLGNSFRRAARMAAPMTVSVVSMPELADAPIQVAATRSPGGQW